MSSSSSWVLSDRLVAACRIGDLPSATAAVADGATVDDEGRDPYGYPILPLAIAVLNKQIDAVGWLLSLGADPNANHVMAHGACFSTPEILHLLIDAGGDVNKADTYPPLKWAVDKDRSDNVRLLLTQPALDFAVLLGGEKPDRYARDKGKAAIADLISHEVSEPKVVTVVRLH